jgi:hypothetical protein
MTGFDQSWGFANPKAAKKAGAIVASMYLSWDPSKNITAAKIRAYFAVGIGCLFNWESLAGAPLKGAAQARIDATEAVRQVRALLAQVGIAHRNRIVIYFSCDVDADPRAVEAYYRAAAAICHAAGFGIGAYGSARVCHYLAALKITDAEWQTYAWSGGVLDPATDFYQFRNGQTLGGASVDFDRVIHPLQLGAYWPAASPYNTGSNLTQETDVTPAECQSAVLTALASKQGQNLVAKAALTALATRQGQAYVARAVLEYPVKIWNGSTASVAKIMSDSHKASQGANSALTEGATSVLATLSSLQQAITGVAVGFDAKAAAVSLRDEFLALIGAK